MELDIKSLRQHSSLYSNETGKSLEGPDSLVLL